MKRSKAPLKYHKSIRFKITLYSVLCVILVSVCGNLYLFSYLNTIIVEKADNIDAIYLESLSTKIETSFEELFQASINSANHPDVVKAMKLSRAETAEEKKSLLQAQAILNEFIQTQKTKPYINKLMILNQHGIMVQAVGNHMAFMQDGDAMIRKKLEKSSTIENAAAVFTLGESITPYKGDCFSILLEINPISGNEEIGYFYMEVDTALVRDLLKEYQQLNYAVVWNEKSTDKQISVSQNPEILIDLVEGGKNEEDFLKKQGFEVDVTELKGTDVALYNYTNSTELSIKNNEMMYTLLGVLALTGLVALGILVIVSKWVTKPISRLILRIQKITKNDFSYDPEIEQTEDEIGEIGRVVNEMVQSVANLMRESIRASEEKSNLEMAMLQAQVNPHFLYNTLDSIYWMSVIQKAPGIGEITKSLSNLLKNMAKGVSDRITLGEELSLLEDYITIQRIRYAGTFEYKNNIDPAFYQSHIVKMTLQPIVENAIFHGIEPSGRLGTISLTAYEEEEYLFICVYDDGVGMDQEKAEALLKEKKGSSKRGMGGIGISNVNRRLKLIYGQDCGLFVESCMNSHTRITVKIRKETA